MKNFKDSWFQTFVFLRSKIIKVFFCFTSSIVASSRRPLSFLAKAAQRQRQRHITLGSFL